MRRGMTDFVKGELFMGDWMRAMSPKDAAAAISDRPTTGRWVHMTVGRH